QIDRKYNEHIPIGKPIANSTVYIVDRNNRLQPVNVAGELLVGGDGVARGYLNRPELTKEKFELNPTTYRTGDMGRWMPDGNIQFLGRMDTQVKLRGFRIELGEIENRLSDHDEIKEAVVLLRSRGTEDEYLCAYFVAEKEFSVPELNEYLAKTLPDYMIPSYFIKVEEIPLTANGKTDTAALPEPGVRVSETFEPPKGRIEECLASIWSGLLFIEKDVIGRAVSFFELGGHSLKATVLTARIRKELDADVPLKEVFRTPTIAGLAGYINTGALTERYAAIQPVEKKDYYILSPAQKRLYILQQLKKESIAYNIPYTIPLPGEIEKEALENVFKTLIHRHESLRTSFQLVNEHPVQRIHDSVEFEIECFGRGVPPWSPLNGNHSGSHGGLPLQFQRDFVRPFDLGTVPLLRVGFLEDEGETPVLLVDMHHIITDGTSQEILAKEFLSIYNGEHLEPLNVHYKDYSQWQNQWRQQELMKLQETYWFRLFSHDVPVLHLPTDHPRPEMQSYEGNVAQFVLNEKETAVLNRLAKETDGTLFMVILAIVNVLLSKLSGQEDIVIGTPIASRRHADLEPIVGMFVNTLAIRNHPAGDKSFIAFLKELKEHTLNAYENQEYPFEELVDQLSLNRDTARNPLFDVMLNLMNQEETADNRHEITGTHQTTNPIPQQYTAKFDLNFSVSLFSNGLRVNLAYCTTLFDAETIHRWIGYFKRIINALTEKKNNQLPIARIDILPEEEKQMILAFSTGEEEDFPTDKTLPQLFEEQAEKTPNRVAITGIDQVTVTYSELNGRANQLAKQLIEKGVKNDSLIGLMMERSIEMIVALLGIMKTGGAYLPV
ncbi:MAG: AMP-binding protein, partial [bacterium]|nr:AMP-binding protein [bacterium]